jgi:hypothetical protein
LGLGGYSFNVLSVAILNYGHPNRLLRSILSGESNDPGIIDPIPDDIGDWKLAGP